MPQSIVLELAVLQDHTMLLAMHPPNLTACPVLWDHTAPLLVQPLVKYALRVHSLLPTVQLLANHVLWDPPLSPQVQRLLLLVCVHRVIGVPREGLLAPPAPEVHTIPQQDQLHLQLVFRVAEERSVLSPLRRAPQVSSVSRLFSFYYFLLLLCLGLILTIAIISQGDITAVGLKDPGAALTDALHFEFKFLEEHCSKTILD